MKKISIVILSLTFLFSGRIVAGPEDLDLLKQHTLEIIKFLELEQDSEQINPSIRITYVKKGGAGKIAKQAFVPKKYDYSTKTNYGEFKVIVFEISEKEFKVSFSSDFPIQQFQLMDTNNKNITRKESLNDVSYYSFVVSKPFEAKYMLILSMNKDNFISQNLIPLYTKDKLKTK
jgi:hypothetical protein